jgi:hypothetical protein
MNINDDADGECDVLCPDFEFSGAQTQVVNPLLQDTDADYRDLLLGCEYDCCDCDGG